MKKVLVLSLVLVVHISHAGPLVGITSESDTVGYITTQMSYIHAVEESGGTPVVLPTIDNSACLQDYLNILDGLLLVGGLDIPPLAYFEEIHPTNHIMTQTRYEFESQLIKRWLQDTNKPIIGICLGNQFANVVDGGSLIQNIPTEVGEHITHRKRGGAWHSVTIDTNSTLFQILETDTATVLSNHHQAVDELGQSFRPVAFSPDSVIEATELNGERFGIFLQWHPERMQDDHKSRLFNAFMNACKTE